jgi:uncharacterized protein Smg (DUF494 family)
MDKLEVRLRNQLGVSPHFARMIVKDLETREMVVKELIEIANELMKLDD